MRTVKDILVPARGLLARGWTRGAFARDLVGNAVDCEADAAVCFCSWGALYRACSGPFLPQRDMAMDALQKASGWSGSLTSWNDSPGRTKEEVLATFDKAIAAQDAS